MGDELFGFRAAIEHGQILLPFALSLFAGFLTSLSPCVYPLIPITLSIMGARRYDSHVHGFMVALSYFFGMTIVYAALGAVFASFGILLGSIMQHNVFLVGIAILLALFSLFMFGVINIVLPQKFLASLSKLGGRGKRGAFIMGLIAGIIAAPCTGPVLGFILTLIADTNSVGIGVLLMLAFSLGFGLPFLVLGTFSSLLSHIPKSGQWMDSIKILFGAAMLGASLYYLSLAIPGVKNILVRLQAMGIYFTIAILVIALVLLLYRRYSSTRASSWVQTGIGVVLSTFAIAALLGYQSEKPIKVGNDHELTWHIINSKTRDEHYIDHLMAKAKAQRSSVLIDFYADWCVACKQLERETFSDSSVTEALKDFVLIRVDASKPSSLLDKVETRFAVNGLPTIIIVDENAEIVKRLQGFLPPHKFLERLKLD